jgi:SAM-dependent methyltransferase
MGYDVIGVEYCEPLVRIANQNHPDVRIEQGDARQLRFPPAAFDAALFSWNGLDYMCPFRDRKRVLDEVRRALKPNGLFLFSSHNALGCVSRLFDPPLMTRRAIRFWLDQLAVSRHHLEWYFRWRDPVLERPLFYSAPPAVQRRILHKQGWTILAARSADRPTKPARTFFDVHVQYICRKTIG